MDKWGADWEDSAWWEWSRGRSCLCGSGEWCEVCSPTVWSRNRGVRARLEALGLPSDDVSVEGLLRLLEGAVGQGRKR